MTSTVKTRANTFGPSRSDDWSARGRDQEFRLTSVAQESGSPASQQREPGGCCVNGPRETAAKRSARLRPPPGLTPPHGRRRRRDRRLHGRRKGDSQSPGKPSPQAMPRPGRWDDAEERGGRGRIPSPNQATPASRLARGGQVETGKRRTDEKRHVAGKGTMTRPEILCPPMLRLGSRIPAYM